MREAIRLIERWAEIAPPPADEVFAADAVPDRDRGPPRRRLYGGVTSLHLHHVRARLPGPPCHSLCFASALFLPPIDACDMTSALFLADPACRSRTPQPDRRLAHVPVQRRRRRAPTTGTSIISACWPIPAPALVVVEATGVERRGRITHGCLGLYSDDCEAALGARRSPTAAATAPPSSASSSPMPAARPPRSGPGKAASALKPGEDPWETIAPSAIAVRAQLARAAGDDGGRHRARARRLRRRRQARGPRRLRRHRAALRPRLSAAQLRVADLQQAQRRLWRLARRRACAFRSKSRRPCARRCRRASPLGARITGSDWLDGGLTPDDAVAFAQGAQGRGARLRLHLLGRRQAERAPGDAASTMSPFAEQGASARPASPRARSG